MIVSIFTVLFCALTFLLGIRSVCSYIVEYLMGKKKYQKAKNGMTFKEWFLFSRFRQEIPKYHIIIYYSIIAFYLIMLLMVIVLSIIGLDKFITPLLCVIIAVTMVGEVSYKVYFESGWHWRSTYINRPDKIILRGIDKEDYKKRMNKLNVTGRQGEGPR